MKSRTLFSLNFIATLLICLFLSCQAWAAPGQVAFVKGELLVQQKAGIGKGVLEKEFAASGASIVDTIDQIRVKRIKVPENALEKVRNALAHNKNIEFVEENFIGQGAMVPNDPNFSTQWHHAKIMTPSAWDYGTGSADIPIAIIDSGVDPAQPDLMGKLLPGYNFVNNNTDTHDLLGHGTSVAGSASAQTNNAIGVAGVSWNSTIMPFVVLDSSNYATYANIASAIVRAVDSGAKVINISIAGSSSSYTLENAVDYAWNHGVLVFAAAANYNLSTPYYPAACTHAIAVAATDSADRKASFSNYGDWITLAAPGVSIVTTNNGGGYSSKSGTSFSSPIAAGVAALIWSVNPQLSNQQVYDILVSTADDLGASGFDTSFGYGRINAYNAMLEALNYQPAVDSEAPVVALTSPAANTTVSGVVAIDAAAADNVAVTKVEFRVDGKLLSSDSSAPFAATWDVAAETAGFHTVEVLAFDGAGNVSLPASAQVYVEEIVKVVDTVPPAVTILSPSNGFTLTSKTLVRASASDENGVVEMQIFVDGQFERTFTGSSFFWRWNTRKLSRGAHVLKVQATDPAGNVGLDEITVYQ